MPLIMLYDACLQSLVYAGAVGVAMLDQELHHDLVRWVIHLVQPGFHILIVSSGRGAASTDEPGEGLDARERKNDSQ